MNEVIRPTDNSPIPLGDHRLSLTSGFPALAHLLELPEPLSGIVPDNLKVVLRNRHGYIYFKEENPVLIVAKALRMLLIPANEIIAVTADNLSSPTHKQALGLFGQQLGLPEEMVVARDIVHRVVSSGKVIIFGGLSNFPDNRFLGGERRKVLRDLKSVSKHAAVISLP